MQSPDLFVWGEPFVQLRGYIAYNAEHAGEYPSGPWYQYGLTLLGLLVPPVSLMLLWGALHPGRSAVPTRWWRIAIPVLVFLLFHSLFSNKQERFILPIIPALIALGVIGWDLWRHRSQWWQRRPRLESALWGLFWAVNVALLAAMSIPYEAKRARVHAMDFSAARSPVLRHGPGGQWGHAAPVLQRDLDILPGRQPPGRSGPPVADVVSQWCAIQPEYILFQGRAHLAESVQEYKTTLPGLRYLTTIQSSRIDRWLERINPINSSERIMIYAVDDALGLPLNDS